MTTSPVRHRQSYVVNVPKHIEAVISAQATATRTSLSQTVRIIARNVLATSPTLKDRVPRTRAQTAAAENVAVGFRMDDVLARAIRARAFECNPVKPVTMGEAVRQLLMLGVENPALQAPAPTNPRPHPVLSLLTPHALTCVQRGAAHNGETHDAFIARVINATYAGVDVPEPEEPTAAPTPPVVDPLFD